MLRMKNRLKRGLLLIDRGSRQREASEEKMDLLLKGDNLAKYPSFKGVMTAFKRNDIQKFQMVTNPENAPVGSELYKKSMSGEKQENN